MMNIYADAFMVAARAQSETQVIHAVDVDKRDPVRRRWLPPRKRALILGKL